jgi:DNA-binding MarR family transcriptional regulator
MSEAGTELADELSLLLGRLHRTLRRAARAEFTREPLPAAQLEVLRTVAAQPGSSVKSIAAVLGTAPNTVSTLVGGLTAARLLDRSRDPANRRAVQLTLTEHARLLIDELTDHRRRVAAQAITALDPADSAALRDALPALRRMLTLLGGDAG